MNTKRHNTDSMGDYRHNGVTYLLDDETFYTMDGIVIGWISSRGSMYVAGLLDDDHEVINRSSGNGEVDMERGIDEPLDDLLAMFEQHQEVA